MKFYTSTHLTLYDNFREKSRQIKKLFYTITP